MNRLSLLALVAALSASPAAAQMTGATLDFGHSFFTEDSDISKTSLGGSAEFGFGTSFALQGDLGYSRLHGVHENATAAALHGMVYVNPETAIAPSTASRIWPATASISTVSKWARRATCSTSRPMSGAPTIPA